MRSGPLIARWIAGACLSLIFVWGLSSLLMDTPLVYVWNETLERYVVAEGIQQHLSEGIATTRTGKYGINAIPDITQITTPIIALWGDSHVDARQVADDEKMAQVITRLWNERFTPALTAIGVGMGGWSMADVYFQLPKYEQLLPTLRCHCVVLSDIEDFRPDLPQRESWLSSRPTLHFEASRWTPEFGRLKAALVESRAYFIWWLLKDVSENVRLRPFRERPAEPPPSEQESVDELPTDAWEFVIRALKERATKPLFFLYLPRAPGLSNGRLKTEYSDAKAGQVFAEICRRLDVPFVDLGPTLVEFARQTRRFPRGFPDTFVWHGHLNADGHRLVAEAVCRFLEENPRVIQSD